MAASRGGIVDNRSEFGPKKLPMQENKTDVPRHTYSIAELAQSTGMCERVLRRHCYQRNLEHCQIGRRIVVTPEQLQRFLSKYEIKR